MIVKINDEQVEIPEGATLLEVLNERNVSQKGTAVALNDSIARSDVWATTVIHEGDSILIISAAYGG